MEISQVIASVVATLDDDGVSDQQQLFARLRCRSELELGECVAARLPMTIEAEDARAMEALTEWLRNCSGIAHVDVVFVHFDT